MARFNSPLNNVRIAAPCNANWDDMIGDEHRRFCGQCNLNVYNLSGMSRSEAELLITRNEGRLCVRFHRRKDGSIITKNCPVGLRAIRRKMSYLARAIASTLLSFFAGLGFYYWKQDASIIDIYQRPYVMGTMVAEPPVLMGDVVSTQPPSSPKPGATLEIGKIALPIKRSHLRSRPLVTTHD